MEQNHIASSTVSTNERAVPSSNQDQTPEKPLFVPSMVSPDLNPTFPPPEPGSRRIRHDGWTPDRIAAFIEALAACGVVADACKSVGLSTQSAYALRNRRAGRAFAIAWDAVLLHRARGRLSDELLSRAMNGCIEAVHQNGAIVGERHRYDNRLSMAVLTRLDRLAEATGDRDAHLRNVSEDMEDFLDIVEAGGDADAFVDARRPPPPPEPEPAPEPAPAPTSRPRIEDDYDRMASLMGCLDYKAEHPFDIDITDLEDLDQSEWSADQLLRAHYSGYLAWRDMGATADPDADGNGEDGDAEEPDDSPTAYKAAFDAVLTRHEGQTEASQSKDRPAAPSEPIPPQPSTSST